MFLCFTKPTQSFQIKNGLICWFPALKTLFWVMFVISFLKFPLFSNDLIFLPKFFRKFWNMFIMIFKNFGLMASPFYLKKRAGGLKNIECIYNHHRWFKNSPKIFFCFGRLVILCIFSLDHASSTMFSRIWKLLKKTFEAFCFPCNSK